MICRECNFPIIGCESYHVIIDPATKPQSLFSHAVCPPRLPDYDPPAAIDEIWTLFFDEKVGALGCLL